MKSNNKKGFIEIAFAVIVMFMIVFLVFLMIIPLSFDVNSEGTHTGFVTAVQKEGLFVKKYRIYFKTDRESSQEDEYCVPSSNQELVNRLVDAQKSKQEITISYSEKFTTGLLNPACSSWEIKNFE